MFKFHDDIPLLARLFGRKMNRIEYSKCKLPIRKTYAKKWRGILYIYKVTEIDGDGVIKDVK